MYSSAIQYVIFLVTTGLILPFIDRIGRRVLLLVGSILCMILHFAIAGTMASYGHYVQDIDGNTILRWRIGGHPAKAVIACSYIFVGIYGFTWVSTSPSQAKKNVLISIIRHQQAGSTARRYSRSSIAPKELASQLQRIGFSILPLPFLLLRLLRTSSGRRILCLVSFVRR